MKEFNTIVREYRKIDPGKNRAALATVIKVRGSSYRSPGARMLIMDDGRWVGSISGGCLEGDALRKARNVMTNLVPTTVTYDTREESNQNLGIGLGCNGIIDVLIEPIDHENQVNPVHIFEKFVNTNESVALATVFNSGNDSVQVGAKLLLTGGVILHQSISETGLAERLRADLTGIFKTKKSETKSYTIQNDAVEVYLELIEPNISLIIFGGGFDARPVSQLAKSLGWDVSVTDECVAHIAPVFFPEADALSLCDRAFIERDFHVTPSTACVLMSHNYEYDRDVLKTLLKSPTPYIGILGPRKRFDKMLEELRARGIGVSNDDMHRIHSPIGLDIGAEAPDEIAVSIVAEIQGKFANRSGGFLKYRKGPIHQRDAEGDQVFKQVHLSVGLGAGPVRRIR